jgi:hypothetical protein
LNKGGNIGGYTALLSFVPELKLSAVVLWNGGQDEFAASDGQSESHLAPHPTGATAVQVSSSLTLCACLAAIYDTIIPPLVSALTPLQPVPSMGPRPDDYLGTYAPTNPHTINATVLVCSHRVISSEAFLDSHCRIVSSF